MWTQFMDMHSGGGAKERWQYIYIEAPKEEANLIFFNRFGHSPERVTCTCCGDDYSVTESKDLVQATGYERGCDYNEEAKEYEDKPDSGIWKPNGFCTLDDYKKRDDIHFIYAADVSDKERSGDIPNQGYVWVD